MRRGYRLHLVFHDNVSREIVALFVKLPHIEHDNTSVCRGMDRARIEPFPSSFEIGIIPHRNNTATYRGRTLIELLERLANFSLVE